MRSNKGYKIAIFILSSIVLIESLLLLRPLIRKPKKIIKPPVAIKGRIAIIIDDWGYNLNNLDLINEIKYPLTVSILPGLPYSKSVSQRLNEGGRQIVLHLPMQPHEDVRLEKNTVMDNMNEAAIKDIIAKDLKNISFAVGVSNHMGSKATEDARIMKIVLKELKRRGLYFIDSFVSSESVGFDLANQMDLPFAQRDIFLDNISDPAYIKGQIEKLKRRASVYGRAIGIGHARKTTLEVLREALPRIEKEGYKFVFASDLVR